MHRVLVRRACSAEFFADILLCPFEAAKVRIQTSTYANTLREAMPKIYNAEGINGCAPLPNSLSISSLL